jgi:hypothetical protein
VKIKVDPEALKDDYSKTFNNVVGSNPTKAEWLYSSMVEQ